MGVDPITQAFLFKKGADAVLPQAPAIPPPTAPEKAPQASKMPDARNFLPKGDTPAAGSTFLTGPKGVDPDALKLGKKTLLGM